MSIKGKAADNEKIEPYAPKRLLGRFLDQLRPDSPVLRPQADRNPLRNSLSPPWESLLYCRKGLS